jgi:hypothetical protein
MAVWFSLWSFGMLFPFWYVWTKKNLATLLTEQAMSPKADLSSRFNMSTMTVSAPLIVEP